MGLLITFFLGLFIIAGAMLARAAKNDGLIEQLSVAVAFGTMTALAAAELLPEALENLEGQNKIVLPACVLLGIVLLKLLDHFIPEHDHVHGFDHNCTEGNVIHIGIVSSVAVIIHNMIEGMAVYSMSEKSVKVGLLVALGVGLHNIPMGMVIYSTLKKEKRSLKTALLSAASLSTFAGGLVMKLLWFIVDDFMIGVLIGLTLGMIVYIVVFELIPHLMHAKRKGLSLAGAIAGAAIIALSSLLG